MLGVAWELVCIMGTDPQKTDPQREHICTSKIHYFFPIILAESGGGREGRVGQTDYGTFLIFLYFLSKASHVNNIFEVIRP